MKNRTIVVIEDEPDIRDVIEHNLKREGFLVLCRGDGDEGLTLILRQTPDLILLDLMLPTIDGLEICKRLKERPDTRGIPVVMVTAKGEEQDIVRGLEMGADDYVTKPFSPKELIARVKTVLRRGPPKDPEDSRETITWDGVVIDRGRHRVTVDGDAVAFTASEFRLLSVLASHPGRVFTRDSLLDRVIGGDAPVVDRNIDVHVGQVRQKLGPYRSLIETVRGVGYRFRDDPLKG